jgi:hypothetical protein
MAEKGVEEQVLAMERLPGFFYLAIIKGPPNDIYFIIEGPCDGYFTEKVSQVKISKVNPTVRLGMRNLVLHTRYPEVSFPCHKLRYFMRS